MSLAVLADHMASKGRGPDSMLIHMSPREVQGLQALAENHGGSLTINPETGLPEAGFLDKLLPTIIGVGLSMAGVPPHVAAMMVGGAETVRTGDLGRGISAGLGAYGGANLSAGMTAAGGATLGAESAAAGLTITPELAGELMNAGAGETAAAANNALQQQVTDRIAAATPFEKLSYGADAFKNNPMGMAKSLAMPAAMAFGPAILAGANVQSKGPQTITKPGMIRPYSFDPYGGTYTAGTPYEAQVKKAAGGGLMGMDNGGYNPGQLNFTQQSEPVVRMAEGGVAHFEEGGGVVYDYGLGGSGSSGVGDYSVREDGSVDYFAQQFAPDVFAPVATAPVVTAPVVTAPNQMADTTSGGTNYQTVNDLYQGVLGRNVESEGASGYWQNLFGPTIDANEAAQFKTAAQAELAGRNAGTTGGLNALAATTPFTNQYTFANINDYIANNNLDAAGIAAAAKTFNVDPAQVTAAQNAQSVVSNVFRNVLGRDPDPNGLDYWTNQIMTGKSTGQEMLSTFIQNAKANNEIITNPNIKLDDAVKDFSGYKSSNARDIADEWVRNTLGREVTASDRQQQWYKDAVNDAVMNTYGKAQDIYGGFKTYAQGEATATTTKAINDAKAALAARGLTEADVVKQTGKTIAQLVAGGTNLGLDLYQASQLKAPGAASKFDFSTIAKPKVVPPVVTPTIIPGINDYGLGGTGTSGALESVYGPALPPGVSGAGITTVNPNGTITTRPDFSLTTNQVRDAYTKGGGSLGYEPYTPKTIEEFDTKYGSRLTGGSKQSLDYLTGKTPYSPTPYTPTGEIMKPYLESVGRAPVNLKTKRYIYDPEARIYKENPAYIKPSYVLAGEKAAADKAAATETTKAAVTAGKSINVLDNQGNTEPAYLREDGFYYTSGGNKFDEKGVQVAADGGLMAMARGGMSQQFDLGGYSDGGRLLRGPGDGVSDSIPATIDNKRPARLADGEFVVPARIVSELGNGSTEAGARKLYAMMDRVQKARRGTVGKGRVAKNSRSEKYLPA